MLCALTVRKLKPGTFDQFRDAFTGGGRLLEEMPSEGWVRFDMLRNTQDPDEVICFGFFDGSMEELRSMEGQEDRSRQLDAIAPFVESVGADGLYEIVEDRQLQAH